jgi:hypothetical protein
MNKFHRHLNIPNLIPNVDFSQWDTNDCKWHEFHKNLTFLELNNPNIEPWLNSMGMTSDWIEVFYTPPNSSGVIHSDNGLGDDWTKIIYQFGAVGSTMRWWSSTKTFNLVPGVEDYIRDNMEDFKGIPGQEVPGDSVECHYNGEVLISWEKDATMIYEAEIGQASLANTGPLHSSHNPTNEKRFVVTIGLFDMNTYERLLWHDVLSKMEVKKND